MKINTRAPEPRGDGDYYTRAQGGYGDPHGEIWLDEAGSFRLDYLSEDDCDRLIRAAAEIKPQVAALRARMTAPHGRDNVYKGTCQLCGQPGDDALHADTDSIIDAEDDGAPDCARPGCGHARFHHWEFGPTTPSSPASGCDLDGCPCAAYAAPETAAVR